MRNVAPHKVLRQLLALGRMGSDVRLEGQRALASGDPRRVLAAGRTVVRALRARGDLVRVSVRGREDDPRRFFALRGHTAVFDLTVFTQLPRESTPPTPPPEVPFAAQLDLLQAMARVQEFQAGSGLHDGGGIWLEGVLAMLVGYLPDLDLALEILGEAPEPDGSGRLFRTSEDGRPFWARVRGPGQSFRITDAAELPDPLRRRFDLEAAEGLEVQAVPLFGPEETAEEVGLLYLLSRRPVGDAILNLALRISAFVTGSWRQRARMARLVHTDPLTGLHNRGFFDARFPVELERCRRNASSLVLLLGDLDHFKSVNDEWGHPMGDRVLRTVARELLEGVRKIDVVSRVGGEEFALLLPDTMLEAAAEVVLRLQVRIANLRLTDSARDEALRVTISFGGVATLEDGADPATLYEQADRMLYLSKQRGRNRCHFWRPDDEPLLLLPAYREG